MSTAFSGTGVALVTPFHQDLSLDLDALKRLVDFVIDGGVDYLVVLGTTAETATLSPEEQGTVLRTVREANAGRVPLVAGIGGNNTLAVGKALQQTSLEGYSAILSVSPYYNRPTQEGIYQHFKHLAAHTPLPLIAYNVPGRTGSNMLPETTLRLARECPEIIGIKEACGDMQQIGRIGAERPDGFLLISGDDVTAVPTIAAGGAGVISVLGQALPEPFTAMIRAALEGAQPVADRYARELAPFMDAIFREGNPAGIKALLHQQGICSPAVRLPLVPASGALADHLSGLMRHYQGQSTL